MVGRKRDLVDVQYMVQLSKFDASQSLILSSMLGKFHTVLFLLQYSGVDPTAYNNRAIIIASKFYNFEVVRILLQDPRVMASLTSQQYMYLLTNCITSNIISKKA